MNNIKDHLDLNNTFSVYPKEKALGDLITDQVNKTPEKIAVKFGTHSLTYRALNEQANQLANLLIANEIKVGDIVGLSIDRSIEMVICFVALLKIGATYIPLDPNFPTERLNYMLTDANAKALITSRNYSYFSTPDRKTYFQEDIFKSLNTYSSDQPIAKVRTTEAVYILYTSGSTGKPKGVPINHQNLLNLLFSVKNSPGMSEKDIFLSITTISFDIFELELYLPLLSGGVLIIADKDTARDGRKILEIVRKEKVTILQATPYTWKMLLESGWEEYLPIKAFCGGEALTKKLAHRLVPRCKELWNMYGPTETTIYSIIKQVALTDKIITVGKPIANTTINILDELNPVEMGEVGEICIGGDGLSTGYLNNPELNEEKFSNDFLSGVKGKRLYRTGDLGKITEDGEVLCLGRIDHQIKIRGFRIETEEVETALTGLDNIDDAILIVHRDSLGNDRLIAYIINNVKIEDFELKEYIESWESQLRLNLPEYMLPQAYHPVDVFPLTPTGKIDKQSLPEPIFKSELTVHIAAETGTEKRLTTIWIKYLGLTDIGVEDNFFDLGGHSIIAVQIVVLIEKEFGKRIPISAFFEHPTIEKIAQLIDYGQQDYHLKTLVQIKKGNGQNPLYLIHGIGLNVLIFNNLAKCLHRDQTVYGLQALGLNGVDMPLETFEAIAECYIKEILEENPDGPINLLGYSMGGIIALEMAKQLKAIGKEVKMLGMIDTNLKQYDGDIRSKIFFNKFKRQFPKALFNIRLLFKTPIIALRYQYSIIKLKLKKIFSTDALAKKELSNDNLPEYMNTIIDKLWIAMDNYKITPYDGRIFLFKAQERIYYVDDFKYLGWQKYAKKGVEIKEVPGDHKVMLLLPKVQQFAEILQEVLDQK